MRAIHAMLCMITPYVVVLHCGGETAMAAVAEKCGQPAISIDMNADFLEQINKSWSNDPSFSSYCDHIELDTRNAVMSESQLKIMFNYFSGFDRSKFSGLTIDHAIFNADLSLNSIELKFPFTLRDSIIKGTLHVDRCSIEDDFKLENSYAEGFSAYFTTFEKSLSLPRLHGAETVDLSEASIGAALDLRGLQAESLLMQATRVARNVTLSETRATRVDASNSVIGGDLYLDGGARIGQLIMERAEIEGQLSMRGVEIRDEARLFGIRVGRDAMLGNWIERPEDWSVFHGPIELGSSQIGSVLNLGGSQPTLVDLGNARIGAGLLLATRERDAIRWSAFASDRFNGRMQLNLQNLVTRDVQDSRFDDWPALIEFDGFVFDRALGFDSGSAGLLSRDEAAILEWLGRGPFLPSIYDRVASLLRASGRWDVADRVVYAKWCREMERADGLRYAMLVLAWLFIGFGVGVHYLQILLWILLATLLGRWVLSLPGAYLHELPKEGQPYPADVASLGWLYSLHRLIPLVSFVGYFGDVVLLRKGVRIYFVVHTIFGYVLAAFLAAGLTLLSG